MPAFATAIILDVAEITQAPIVRAIAQTILL